VHRVTACRTAEWTRSGLASAPLPYLAVFNYLNYLFNSLFNNSLFNNYLFNNYLFNNYRSGIVMNSYRPK
jgi:hypothetical protein